MFLLRKRSSTSNYLRVPLRSSSTGQGLTALTSASAGLIISTICDNEAAATTYTAAGSTIETIATLGTFATPTATKCRFKEVDATNQPGLYELQLDNARFAVASSKSLRVTISGATGLMMRTVVVQLTDLDVDDAVRGGMSALPNVAQGNAGQLALGDATGKPTLAAVTHTGATVPTVTTLTNAPADSAGTATLLARFTAARAGYLDNLNVAGVVATQADINALNQSASRRVILTTVGQYERPESSSSSYTVEARTYGRDGNIVNADTTPTLTATGITSGSLAANLSAASNPATGVYRWTYTVASSATLEQVRFDLSATVETDATPMAVYAQVCDLVASTFTTADRTTLQAAATATALATAQTSINALPNAAAIADAVVDEDLSPHAVDGSLSLYIRNAGQSLSQIKVATDRFLTMIALSGSSYVFTIPALANAPAGGGGGDPWETDLAGDTYTGTQAGRLLARLSPTSLTVQSPVDVDDDDALELVQGDDHTAGVKLPSWTIDDYTGPTLTAAGKLRLLANRKYQTRDADLSADLEVDATIATAGSTVTVEAPITADQTAELYTSPPADGATHRYQLIGYRQDNGRPYTLLFGAATVLRSIDAED
jgi:hypothetical protein